MNLVEEVQGTLIEGREWGEGEGQGELSAGGWDVLSAPAFLPPPPSPWDPSLYPSATNTLALEGNTDA